MQNRRPYRYGRQHTNVTPCRTRVALVPGFALSAVPHGQTFLQSLDLGGGDIYVLNNGAEKVVDQFCVPNISIICICMSANITNSP